MVKKSVAHFKAVGLEKAMADFNEKDGSFKEGTLYVFVNRFDGLSLANAGNPKLAGRSTLALKDVDGKAFVEEYTNRAKSGKSGWTDYRWPNPITKEVEAKTTYCEPVQDMAFCSGVYK